MSISLTLVMSLAQRGMWTGLGVISNQPLHITEDSHATRALQIVTGCNNYLPSIQTVHSSYPARHPQLSSHSAKVLNSSSIDQSSTPQESITIVVLPRSPASISTGITNPGSRQSSVFAETTPENIYFSVRNNAVSHRASTPLLKFS